ncbi:MAG: DUF190 domain-containing protein [Ignavibacterium sp.]|nr:DUF190 domain-containing protein [Ignavibacterium sp.]
MELNRDSKLLRIFVGDSDKIGSLPVYEKIVLEAKKLGLAGATVFKGFMGFGQSSRLHTAKILRLSEDLPIVIEIVDVQNKIDEFLPILDKIFEDANCGGLVTIEKAEVIKYTGRKN